MKQVLITGGTAIVDEVPAPEVGPRGILVRARVSCVSVGTEMAAVRGSDQSLYRMTVNQPERVKKVLRMLRDEGLQRTADAVRGKLAAGQPTGYSAAGEILAVGADVEGFAVGDRVACAGATANHAEVIDVPASLAAKLPDAVTYESAATVALGAIALQGIRRAAPTLGETVVVVGLGILGQLTMQMLRANGCRVIGVDIDRARIDTALACGMQEGIDPATEAYVGRVQRLTEGFGADAVIITAATPSHEVISEAMQACRKKGRVVLVGDVGLHLNRADLYRKELDFLISTSYGPGRYDPAYEEGGQDYPLPYVRWTETRNMSEYLRLIAEGSVRLGPLYDRTFTVDEATTAYEALKQGGSAPLLVLLTYPEREAAQTRTVRVSAARLQAGAIRVALVGAGQFARAAHLPNLKALKEQFALRAVVDRIGANAKTIAAQFGASYATSDFDAVLGDAEVDLVIIATRHNLHAAMALQALQAGKHVLVEKPMAISEAELEGIRAFFADRADPPVLMTGYNRRFSPAMTRAREVLAARTTPLIMSYRMNAGYIPLESWIHGEEGGGRNIGEACHIYDLFGFFTGAEVAEVSAHAIRPTGRQWARNDNFVATARFTDGSVCSLTYTALGDSSHPKERMEIYADGKVVSMDDFKSLTIAGGKHPVWTSRAPRKGQLEELEALARRLSEGGEWPIPLWQQLQTTAISFEVERQLQA